MQVAAILLIMSLCLLGNCNDKSRVPQSLTQDTSSRTTTEVIDIAVDVKQEEKIQRAVEDGHQPWRLSAADVACASLAAHGIDVNLSDCRVEQENKGKAVATAQMHGITYRVYLEQMIKPDGIWTAKKIEIAKPIIK